MLFIFYCIIPGDIIFRRDGEFPTNQCKEKTPENVAWNLIYQCISIYFILSIWTNSLWLVRYYSVLKLHVYLETLGSAYATCAPLPYITNFPTIYPALCASSDFIVILHAGWWCSYICNFQCKANGKHPQPKQRHPINSVLHCYLLNWIMEEYSTYFPLFIHPYCVNNIQLPLIRTSLQSAQITCVHQNALKSASTKRAPAPYSLLPPWQRRLGFR